MPPSPESCMSPDPSLPIKEEPQYSKDSSNSASSSPVPHYDPDISLTADQTAEALDFAHELEDEEKDESVDDNKNIDDAENGNNNENTIDDENNTYESVDEDENNDDEENADDNENSVDEENDDGYKNAIDSANADGVEISTHNKNASDEENTFKEGTDEKLVNSNQATITEEEIKNEELEKHVKLEPLDEPEEYGLSASLMKPDSQAHFFRYNCIFPLSYNILNSF